MRVNNGYYLAKINGPNTKPLADFETSPTSTLIVVRPSPNTNADFTILVSPASIVIVSLD